MAKVRVRPETGRLYLDFTFRGVRCREQTALRDTARNRQTVERLLARIVREISQGSFDYARTFPGSANAARFAPQAHPEGGEAEPSVADTPAFDAFAAQWMRECSPQWRPSYQRSIRYIVESDLVPAFGTRSLAEISKSDVLDFRGTLATRKKRKGGTGPARINKIMGVLRQILNEGAERFAYPQVFRNIRSLKTPHVDIQPFTLDEVELLIETIRPDYRNYLTTRFFTGMRSGEINGLRWQNVDLDSRLIHVRETLVGGELRPWTKTRGSVRDIPMIPRVFEALSAQSRERTPGCPSVFYTRRGNPINAKNFSSRVWHPLLRHLGLSPRRPYETRHTAATLMLASGESPEWVARVLGHTTTEMLFRIYSRYVPNLTRNDGRAFGGLVAMHAHGQADALPDIEDLQAMNADQLREALALTLYGSTTKRSSP